jgi:hypothetical protein
LSVRRVIAKAEVTAEGDNPRFIVTNLPAEGFKDDEDRSRFPAAPLYAVSLLVVGRPQFSLRKWNRFSEKPLQLRKYPG